MEITDPVALRQVPAQYANESLFHPTFAYEALWNLGVAAIIIGLTRWGRLKSGRLFAVYMVGYGIGRLIMETLRIDPANTILGLRVNTWMSLGLIVFGLIWLLWKGPLRSGPTDAQLVAGANAKAEKLADKNKAENNKAENNEADNNTDTKNSGGNNKAEKNKAEKNKAQKNKAEKAADGGDLKTVDEVDVRDRVDAADKAKAGVKNQAKKSAKKVTPKS